MVIQFSLPDEVVAAAKEIIKRVDAAKPDPSDADVLDYIRKSLMGGMLQLFPGVVLASQAEAAAQVAMLTASLEAGLLAAINVQVVE